MLKVFLQFLKLGCLYQRKFDLIIYDVVLPDGDGLELVKNKEKKKVKK